MSRAERNDKKLAILEVIKRNKDILLASLQDNVVTKKQKEEAWSEVLAKAKSLGMASSNRKWTFARDNLFGMWKSRMLAKKDKLRPGGRKIGAFDVVDEAILDIVRKDSPLLEEINLSAPGDGDVVDIKPSMPISQTTQLEIPSSSRKNSSPMKRKSQIEDDELKALKKKLLKVEIYKTTLEAYKLERELRLPLSEFTKEIKKTAKKFSVWNKF